MNPVKINKKKPKQKNKRPNIKLGKNIRNKV